MSPENRKDSKTLEEEMWSMKKKIALLLTFLLVLGLPVMGIRSKDKVYAKEAQMYLEVPESVKKENEFTVNVVLNSDVDLYSVDAYLSYDADLLEFVSKDDCVTGGAGVLEIKDTYNAETKKASYELTFKALDTGKVEIALTDVFLVDYADLDYIEVASSAKNFEIGVNTAEDTDARLSDLIVAPGELTEPFQPGKTEYEMHVGLDVDMIGVSAVPMEEDSVIGLEMPEKLQIGENTVLITVTALSGHVKTYTIKVYREELPEEKDLEDTQETSTESDMGETTEDATEMTEEDNSTETKEDDTTETATTQSVTTQEVTTEYVVPESNMTE